MVKDQDYPGGDYYPNFGVYNDEDNEYKKFKTGSTIPDAIYIIKANAPINTEAHSLVQAQFSSGKIKLLIDERSAKNKLLSRKVGQAMTPDQRAAYLRPFQLTSILKEEMMNLREENEGININLKQANRNIRKDKFSAMEYGLYYIRKEEELKRKGRRKFNAKDWLLMN